MNSLQSIFFIVAMMALLVAESAMAIEEADYTVLLKEEDFELRQYEPHILAETVIDGDFEDAGSKAFQVLFQYISGNNRSKQEIDMTSPVGQAATGKKIEMTSPVGQTKENGKWTVSFMMPASFTMDTLPEPNDPNVALREVPAHYMAAIRYSGFWNEERYLENKARLVGWINNKRLNIIGEPTWARYDPPFMPWFLRRNEILIPIEKPGSEK